MTVHSKHPRKKSAIIQGTAVLGRNGLPVDTCVSFDTSVPILTVVGTAITYATPVVTVDASVDLNLLIKHNNKNTQVLALEDSKHKKYYIDKNTINNTTKTFNIYTEFDASDPLNITFSSPPTSINLGSGWSAHELKWVNRLAVTSDTIIENVEFGNVDMHVGLDGKAGDSVRIVDIDGDELDVQPDGSVNVNAKITLPDTIDLQVQTTHLDNSPDIGDIHDSMRIGDGTNLLEVTNKKNARVVDTLHCGGVSKLVNITSTPVEVKVAGSAKSDRKTIFIQPRAKGIFWSFDSSVTADDTVTGGAPLGKNQPLEIDAEANTPIYLIGPVGGIKVFISEA
jgi:hypothetical protein